MSKKFKSESEPIKNDIPLNEEVFPILEKMSIYDAFRAKKITVARYQKYLNDGYPKRMQIDI
jgi:hypothetical protein